MIETSHLIVRLKNLIPFMDAAAARQDHHMMCRYSKEMLEICALIYGSSSANDEERFRIRELDEFIRKRKEEIASLMPAEVE